MRQNKKGFTLVELLAVIVILAVVMLIAVTSVGPMMEKSRKGALGTEGVSLIDAAKLAFNAEQLKASGDVKSNSTVCFDIDWLKANNYFDKGDAEKYHGSVLLLRKDGGNIEYYFWLTNETYTFKGAAPNTYVAEEHAKDYKDTDDTADIMNKCGGTTNTFKAGGKFKVNSTDGEEVTLPATGLVKCFGSDACEKI